MEIGPIAGIRVMPMMKAPPVERELSAVFDIEGLARPVDDAWSGDGKKSAGEQEDEADDLFVEDESESSADSRRVNFFA